MSSSGTTGVRSGGQEQEDRADVTSGYNTGGEEEKTGVGSARERRRKEEAAREKLKEELLRQFEAGQLKAEKDVDHTQASPSAGEIQKLLRDYKVDGVREAQPRHIPTIEEQRDKTAFTRRSIQPPPRQAAPVPLPDLSRPPPGFFRPAVQAVPFYQPQPMYSYEDTIVTRVLQSLMGSRVQQQVELPNVQPQGVNEVVSLDGSRMSLGGMERSLSRERRTRSRERTGARSRPPKRRRSLSTETVCRPVDRGSSRRKRSRSRSRYVERKLVRSTRSERAKSVERLLRKSNQHHSQSSRRDLSPLTRTCSLRTEKPREGKRKHESHSVGNSPRSRKIVLLSPKRVNKSVREVIMDERDHTRMKEEHHERTRSPVKKRVKDRLGVRKEPEQAEVYNMDTNLGRCGAVAIIKEYIDSKSGIMELRTSEGGRGAVILFSAEQVWIPDRKLDPNGPPKSYVLSSSSRSLPLQSLFPVGQELLINARKVESPLVDLQATAVWPKFTELPDYKVRTKKLDEELDNFHEVCNMEKLVPVCINGLAPVGSLNIWSARVRQIVDQDWGVVEIKSVPRDGKREFSFRFFCFFHKSDVWLEEGICVGEHRFFKDKPLCEIVELLQPVDVVARSIIREKGLTMKKAVGSTVEMQALCVSLKPDCIPEGAPRGTRVEGGPGAFGGSNRGETPFMFRKGLDHILNVKLAKYLQASGKVCHNLDPSLVVEIEEVKTLKNDDKTEKNVQKLTNNDKAEKKVHKLTKNVEPIKTKPVARTVTVDSQNNIVEAVEVRPPIKLYEKLSNSTARVKEYISESVGLLENLTRDWLCLFQTSDCVLTQGSKALELYPVGTKVQLNANLVDASQQVQYIASCVWRKSENAMILPNNVEKTMISASKNALFHDLNLKLSHLDLKSGVVVKILDDNFGVIKQGSRVVLFDTCDFWTSQEATASQSNKSLSSLVSLGDTVMLHAALVQSSSMIPYLATAVWLSNPSPFPSDKCPVAIRREKIHPDKIKIYEMVSRCSALQEELPEVTSKGSTPDNTEGAGTMCKTKVYDQKGLVKLAFKLKGTSGLAAAIVEFTKSSSDKKHFAFYLASSSVETHEKTKVCVPGTKVYFSANPVCGDFPVSHIATAVSHIHNKMPLNDDTDRSVEAARETLKKIMEQKVPQLADLGSVESQIISLDVSNKSKAKDPNVIDCFPTGRLVCMFDENAGIMEDHRRELAYFEKGDLNLPSELEMKDIVMVMTRCRDVTIRFQATHALEGPVKMIVHDGTIAISSNLERYFPEVHVKKTKISMKPNSFTSEKVSRAKVAVEMYKVDKFLTPDYIIDSGEFKSTLVKPKRYGSSSSSSISSSIKPAAASKPDVKCLVKQTGKVMTILNDSFCLLKFCQPDSCPGYCLFDTFDLYLEGGRTAAQSKLTVANVLNLDMEVCFHACEISPGSSVPWLATGVWRQEKASQPKPVAYSKITKEKIAVFKKVAETCSVLVAGDSVFKAEQLNEVEIIETEKVEGADKTMELNIIKEVEPNVKSDNGVEPNVKSDNGVEPNVKSENKQEVSPTKPPSESVGNGNMTELPETAENGPEVRNIDKDFGDKFDKNCLTICEDKENEKKFRENVVEKIVHLELDALDPVVKKETFENPEAEDVKEVSLKVESSCAEAFLKEEVLDIIDDLCKTSVECNLMDGVNVDYNNPGPPDCSSKKCSLDEDFKIQSEVASPLLSLPKFLTDQTSSGNLEQQLSSQFVILSLDFPAGTKALLHCDRLWLADQAMSVWDKVAGQVLGVSARRVEGFEEFDYQVTSARVDSGVAMNEEEGGCSITAPSQLAEDKLEVEMLDKELEMFKEK